MCPLTHRAAPATRPAHGAGVLRGKGPLDLCFSLITPWLARYRASPGRRGPMNAVRFQPHPTCPTAFSLMGNGTGQLSTGELPCGPATPYPTAAIIAAIAARVGTSRIGLRNSGQLDSFTATALCARSI